VSVDFMPPAGAFRVSGPGEAEGVEQLRDVSETAAALKVATTTLYDVRWRRRHQLMAIRIGNRLRFSDADIAAWLERRREDSQGPAPVPREEPK
jgi:hypothetical protein